MQRATLRNLAAIATPAALLLGRGQNRCLPRNAALCAVAALAALAILIAAAWHPPLAHADGGASARNQAVASTPDDSGATIEDYAQRILRALSDDDTNNWVRYWRARADCDAAAARDGGSAPLDRVLLGLTGMLCAQLDARLAVNPADYSPRGEERTEGLLVNEPDAAAGYTLFTRYRGGNAFLIDPLGRIAHAWHLDMPLEYAKLLDNGNLLTISRVRRVYEFDPRGNIVWQYNVGDGRRLHHDFLKMPNGNVLLLVQGHKTREEAIAAGANPEFAHENGLDYDYLLEVRPTGARGGEIVWEWSAWDHLIQDFDPTKPNYGAIAEHPELIDINFLLQSISERRPFFPSDWLHANAIDYNPELDQIMLSPRHFSELWIIDHSAATEEARGSSGGNSGMGGDLLYRWGNPRAYDHGTLADQRLFWQHQPHWIPPGLPGAGNILLFNNGYEFSGDERFYSSIDEIIPPVDGYRYRRAENAAYPPDGLEWTYAAQTPADFYAPVMSGTQRLPNGNTLIVDGTAGAIFQATPEGRTVWKYIVPWRNHILLRQDERASARFPRGTPEDTFPRVIYRARWHPPDHPALQSLDLAPGAYLEGYEDLRDWARATVLAGDFGQPLADADFDIYLNDDGDENTLIYFKRPCAVEDAWHPFFLHIFPANAGDLPGHRQEHGFDNRDFGTKSGRVYLLDDWCIAIAPLPPYPIERIRTGQVTHAGQIWRAEIELGE